MRSKRWSGQQTFEFNLCFRNDVSRGKNSQCSLASRFQSEKDDGVDVIPAGKMFIEAKLRCSPCRRGDVCHSLLLPLSLCSFTFRDDKCHRISLRASKFKRKTEQTRLLTQLFVLIINFTADRITACLGKTNFHRLETN